MTEQQEVLLRVEGLKKYFPIRRGVFQRHVGDVKAVRDSASMRRAALEHGVPYFTTAAGGEAAARAIRALRRGDLLPLALQDLHASR